MSIKLSVSCLLLILEVNLNSFISSALKHDREVTQSSGSLTIETEHNTRGIAWLMSFPNSGTTYTQRLIQTTTRRSVASNYGHEMIIEDGNVGNVYDRGMNSIPINEGDVNGPFRVSSNLPLPSDGYVLTKTHCGGYCFSDCPPSWYRLSPLKFLQECRLGTRYEFEEFGKAPKQTWVQYDYHNVKRAIHLIRSPFDNIVSRFFHEFKTHLNENDSDWVHKYPKTPMGFRSWCENTDRKWKYHEKNIWGKDTFNAAEGVLCHGELIRYVRWHNNAFALLKAMDIPTMVVHYEDFEYDFEGTLNSLQTFLNLEAEADPIPFLNSFHELSYFDNNDLNKMSTFMKHIASEDSLKHMEGYFVEKEQNTVEHNGLVFYNVKAEVKEDAHYSNSGKELVKMYHGQTYYNMIPKENSLMFYNIRRRNTVDNLDTDPEISRRTLSLINEDWQNNEASIEEKYYNLQSRLSEVWESSETKGYFLQYFLKPKRTKI